MSEAVRRAMAPNAAEIAAAPLSSHAAVLADLLGGKGSAALDIGCGDGTFTWLMTKHFPRVTGIDVKAVKIAEANAQAREKGVAAQFQVEARRRCRSRTRASTRWCSPTACTTSRTWTGRSGKPPA